MILKELLEVLSGPDELLIVRDAEKEVGQKIIYKGYKGMLAHSGITQDIMEETVTRFSFHPEIRCRDWEKRNLMPPMDPGKTPNFLYKDMKMSIYYKISLKGGQENGESNMDTDQWGN